MRFDDIQILCGSALAREFHDPVPKRPFSNEIIGFLMDMSRFLLEDMRAKAFPDIVTFAFFCRKAHLESLRNQYADRSKYCLGRGVTLHIAPSNVPVNFAYSLVVGLLAGNACLVRVSQKPFAQTDIICDALTRAFSIHTGMAQYISVFRSPHSEEINTFLSGLCDVRVIWGGDETIATIRRAPLPPRSFDICFADRYSIAIFDAEAVMRENAIEYLIQGFYNDTYLFDQNACSSPRLILWLGTAQRVQQAKARFWSAMEAYLLPRYTIEPVIAVDKETMACRCALDIAGIHEAPRGNNLIRRIDMDILAEDPSAYRAPGGFFLEHNTDNFEPLKRIVNRKYQTVAYFGIDSETLRDFILNNGLQGIDRIKPIGKTSDFSLSWDGYDMIMSLSREISWG